MNSAAYRFYKASPGSGIKIFSEDFFNDPEYKLSEIFSFLGEPNFINAIDASKVKVNGSTIPNEYNLDIEPVLRAGLTKIYKGLLCDEPYENINWLGYDSGNEYEAHNHNTKAFTDIIS
jgi:hypothetical protein